MKKGLTALALGTLGLGITEFVMMGILPDVAQSLGVSIPEAGHLISIYALGVCVGAPVITLMARTRPLKQILISLAVIYTVASFSAAIVPDMSFFIPVRFMMGFPHGAFFGVGSIVAARMAGKEKSASAIAYMVSGMTIANVIGVPLGTFLSHFTSWRVVFLSSGVWGLMVLYSIWRWVPYMDPVPDTGVKGQFRFLTHWSPWLILLATMFGNGGIFCWYSYISPLMQQVSGVPSQFMTFVMISAGICMVMGNYAGGRLSDRYMPSKVACSMQVLAAVTLLLIFFTAQHTWLSLTGMGIVTACLFGVSAPQQLLILRYSYGGEMMAAASIQIAFNLGNAIGAYLGGLPIEAGLGYKFPSLIGSAVVLAGALSFWVFTHRTKPIGHGVEVSVRK